MEKTCGSKLAPVFLTFCGKNHCCRNCTAGQILHQLFLVGSLLVFYFSVCWVTLLIITTIGTFWLAPIKRTAGRRLRPSVLFGDTKAAKALNAAPYDSTL